MLIFFFFCEKTEIPTLFSRFFMGNWSKRKTNLIITFNHIGVTKKCWIPYHSLNLYSTSLYLFTNYSATSGLQRKIILSGLNQELFFS